MGIVTSSGTINSAPRIIETRDTRAGCPGTLADGGLIMSQSFTVDNSCVYLSHGRVIYNPGARGGTRADINIRIDGSLVKYALNTSTYRTGGLGDWEELNVTYTGTLAAGTHTITIYGSNGANCWGCGTDWGQLQTLIWEVS